jgi:hypothetical protein
MDWYKILSALFLVAMLVYIFPRMSSALKDSPKGDTQDWKAVLIPLIAVAGFVVLLISLV